MHPLKRYDNVFTPAQTIQWCQNTCSVKHWCLYTRSYSLQTPRTPRPGPAMLVDCRVSLVPTVLAIPVCYSIIRVTTSRWLTKEDTPRYHSLSNSGVVCRFNYLFGSSGTGQIPLWHGCLYRAHHLWVTPFYVGSYLQRSSVSSCGLNSGSFELFIKSSLGYLWVTSCPLPTNALLGAFNILDYFGLIIVRCTLIPT
jgi:hypothetical protein